MVSGSWHLANMFSGFGYVMYLLLTVVADVTSLLSVSLLSLVTDGTPGPPPPLHALPIADSSTSLQGKNRHHGH